MPMQSEMIRSCELPPFQSQIAPGDAQSFWLRENGREAPQVDTGYPGSIGDHLGKVLQGFVIPQTWLGVDNQSNVGRYIGSST